MISTNTVFATPRFRAVCWAKSPHHQPTPTSTTMPSNESSELRQAISRFANAMGVDPKIRESVVRELSRLVDAKCSLATFLNATMLRANCSRTLDYTSKQIMPVVDLVEQFWYDIDGYCGDDDSFNYGLYRLLADAKCDGRRLFTDETCDGDIGIQGSDSNATTSTRGSGGGGAVPDKSHTRTRITASVVDDIVQSLQRLCPNSVASISPGDRMVFSDIVASRVNRDNIPLAAVIYMMMAFLSLSFKAANISDALGFIDLVKFTDFAYHAGIQPPGASTKAIVWECMSNARIFGERVTSSRQRLFCVTGCPHSAGFGGRQNGIPTGFLEWARSYDCGKSAEVAKPAQSFADYQKANAAKKLAGGAPGGALKPEELKKPTQPVYQRLAFVPSAAVAAKRAAEKLEAKKLEAAKLEAAKRTAELLAKRAAERNAQIAEQKAKEAAEAANKTIAEVVVPIAVLAPKDSFDWGDSDSDSDDDFWKTSAPPAVEQTADAAKAAAENAAAEKAAFSASAAARRERINAAAEKAAAATAAAKATFAAAPGRGASNNANAARRKRNVSRPGSRSRN